jgi:hypothetical protein
MLNWLRKANKTGSGYADDADARFAGRIRIDRGGLSA